MKGIECRFCGVLFDPENPYHKEVGFYNACRECSDEHGDVEVYKAHVNRTEEGDFFDLTLMKESQFEKLQQIQESARSLKG